MKTSVMKVAAVVGGIGLLGYAMLLCNPTLMEDIRKKASSVTDDISDKIKEDKK